MTPTYRMPGREALLRQALVSDINNALSAARCSAQLAGMETDEFVVRELLRTVIEQIDRAACTVRRLSVTSFS